MMPSRRLIASTAAATALWASPAAAQSVTSLEPCPRFVPGEATFPVALAGFTPGQAVTITADGAPLGSGIADAAGAFSTALSVPALTGNRTRKTFQIAATDAAGVAAPPIAVPVVRFGVDLPERARPRSRVRFRALGFPNGATVHLHVRRNDRTLGSFRIGVAAPPCGIVERRLRYMPLRSYRTGTYDYAFQPSARYDPSAPTVLNRILIFRTFRRPGSS